MKMVTPRLALTAALGLAAIATGQANASFVVDQSQTVQQSGGSANYSIGQSFTPTATSMDTVEFTLFSEGSTTLHLAILNGLSGTNGLAGTVLATGNSVVLSNSSLTPIDFQLTSPLAVTPGQTYVAELVFDGGSYVDWAQAGNLYAGGQMLQGVYPASGGPGLDQQDYVFREGLTTAPEPASLTLIGMTGLGLASRRRRK